MSHVEYVCIFVRAVGDRLLAAERLVLAAPRFVGDAFLGCDLRFRASSKFLGVVLRLSPRLTPAERQRLAFWTARSGGRAMEVASLTPEDREKIEVHLGAAGHERDGLTVEQLFEETGRYFTDAGAPRDRRRDPRGALVMGMDVGGPGWEGARWDAEGGRLFVAAPVAPPVGDELPLVMRVPGEARPLELTASVVEVRTPSSAAPGQAAGFTLQLADPPPRLLEALATAAKASGSHDGRAAPRFTVNAPVKIIASPAPGSPAAAPQPLAGPEPARALIEYATDQELAADFVENLSQGGAFVRSATPSPVGTPLELQLRLPNGADLRAKATVAFVNRNGMGVRFQLDADGEGALAAAIAHISARQRRALVVDDDELTRRLLGDALRERGFEVLTALDAQDGLGTLADELLALDLLVTDVVMPGMDGEEFVRLIRKAGGETDLAIVAVSGHLEPGMEPKLEAAGADAVLDKSLGVELIAQAADAVLERKRLGTQG